MTSPALSVLDLVPVRRDQTTGDALAATRALARVADDRGFRRYWLAEHHNMPAVAATNPPVLIAMVAAATERIRVGSGGVMLPNHAPLVVAEQFALLEAAYPGRIDLGLGRAPGTDPVTSWALRHGAGGVDDEAVARFPSYVDDIVTMMSPGGAGLQVNGRMHALNATPHASSVADVWLLGSSDYSAQVAAAKGLPYVFAHHFSGRGTAEALELYRSAFVPNEEHPEPRTFLTVNAVVAPTQEEADRLVLPNLLSMIALRTGGQLAAQLLVEEAEERGLPEQHRALAGQLLERWVVAPTQEEADRLVLPNLLSMVALRTGGQLAAQLLVEEAEERGFPEQHRALAGQLLERWVVGTPDDAAKQVAELASTYDVDEVMIHPVAGALSGTPTDRAPAREQTLALLADALG